MIHASLSLMLAPLNASLLLQGAPPQGGVSVGQQFFIQIGLVILIFWFLVFRPQQKQRKRHDDALRAMKRGDRVVTAGGIVAEVVHIKEGVKEGKPSPSMDDEVTIKSGESRLIVERGRIAKIVTPGGTSEAPAPARGPRAGGSTE